MSGPNVETDIPLLIFHFCCMSRFYGSREVCHTLSRRGKSVVVRQNNVVCLNASN